MDTCVLHYDSVDNNEKLLCLSSRSAWLTILEAAKVRKRCLVGNIKALFLTLFLTYITILFNLILSSHYI